MWGKKVGLGKVGDKWVGLPFWAMGTQRQVKEALLVGRLQPVEPVEGFLFVFELEKDMIEFTFRKS